MTHQFIAREVRIYHKLNIRGFKMSQYGYNYYDGILISLKYIWNERKNINLSNQRLIIFLISIKKMSFTDMIVL